MTNRQIQPVRSRDIQIIRQARPRSVLGQVWSVTLQPNNFFLALPEVASSSRQWFWVAVLILALNGFAAVRQEALASGGGNSPAVTPITQNPSDFSGKGEGFSASPSSGGISAQPFPSGPSPDLGASPSPDSGVSSDISSTWVTALISATTILVGWFILALILCEVPLFNGVRPSYSQNLQIAIWTTVPLGIMAGLQVIYLAAGGKVGADGISGLLTYWKGFNDLSPILRSIVLSLTSRLTVFWIWTLVLIYIGGRMALNGKPWAVALVVVVWVAILVLVPVITGAIKAPEVVNTDLPQPITLPSDNSVIPEATVDDFLLTPMPDNGTTSDLSTPPAASGDGNVLPTLEDNGDSSLATALPSENNELPTAESEQVTPTPS